MNTPVLKISSAALLMSRPDTAVTDGARVVGVVVTNTRPVELHRLLARMVAQSHPLERIIVVDNGGSVDTAGVTDRHPLCERINGKTNLGGAGGFALGLAHALATGADYVWVMDDDGYPEQNDALATLIREAEINNYGAVSPMVVDIEDEAHLSFPFRRGLRFVTRVDDLQREHLIEGFAHLFNGLLLTREALMRTGLPDLRLFIRGDELDFHYRMRTVGVRFATVTSVAYRHPSSKEEIVPIIPGVLHVVWPPAGVKRERFFRNRGYLIRRHGLWLVLCRDIVCYPWFFLIKRRGDFAGLGRWVRALLAGSRERF